MHKVRTVAAVLFVLAVAGRAPTAEIPPIPRKLPPPGIAIPAEERAKLQAAADAFAARLKLFRATGDQELLPDVEIYLHAVQLALENDEFFDLKDVARAQQILSRGEQRLVKLFDKQPSWPSFSGGTLVRGFRSRLDYSVQPYGLVLPKDLNPLAKKDYPLYVWLHGRGDKATEINFILSREGKPGELQPVDAIVLHPFGRYCNGFKFAGEIDVLEAIESVKQRYPVDADKIVLCGFSMGGAGAWHLGAHYADHWVAVSPGAGFAETARYQNLKPENYPPWYVQTLWGLYDVPDYVLNLFNIPVIAYSGENDKQIQAARIMEEAYQREGRTLTHLIGPGMGHKYHPDTLKQLHEILAAETTKFRPPLTNETKLETRTLALQQDGADRSSRAPRTLARRAR